MQTSPNSITITRPDDWHLHLRDGATMASVLPHTARQFARAIVMPNLKPPVTTTAQALAYRDRILAALPSGMDFEPLMTLYLTDNTAPEEIIRAKESGVASKLIATVSDLEQIAKLVSYPDYEMNARGRALLVKEVAKSFRRQMMSTRSPEFATIYANAAPGFFPLIDKPVTLENALAKEIVGWRGTCQSSIRSTYQILSRGTPNLENETWVESANVINGTDTPEAAAKKLQDGLDSWYKPAK